MADSRNASPPGRTWRWMSARSAVSVRRGSMTMSDRSGSAAIAFSVGRACGKPCAIHGFLPTKTATCARSKSGAVWVTWPNRCASIQISPVFSWASALDENRTPSAERVAPE